ncbi:MAG: hypothetical protein ABR969_01025 [Sedimentisphaerales bacterium]
MNEIVNFIDFAIFANQWMENCAYPEWCQGCDFNKSGRVDTVDLKFFAENYLCGNIQQKIPGDFDGNGKVDFVDFAEFATVWQDN